MGGGATGDPAGGTGDELARRVRDALAHLADPVYLQTHPLAGLVSLAGKGWPAGRVGEALRRRLLRAIADLEPQAKSGERGGAWRVHRLLELRYAEGLSPEAVQDQLGLSRAQYFRAQARAVAAVASLLEPAPPAAGERAAPATPAARADGAPGNLPAPLTSFVGRERELAAVVDRLSAAAGPRLLILSGPGGIGKTRLALAAAATPAVRATLPDGVWLVELAALADPAVVPAAVAGALGVRAPAGRALLDVLEDALRPKRLLLVLDNCEHLVDACAALAGRLLGACSGLRVLATSRQALGVAGEAVWRVPPLPAPPPSWAPDANAPPDAGLWPYGAVRLFVERAQAALPTFRLTAETAPAVAEVCRRLDGIPLALELAAARVGALTVDLLAQRLSDRFRLLTGGSRSALPRHRTLRALLDWSHDLLSEPERALFRRLAVFAGGWTLAAAEGVCAGDPVAPEDVLDLLTQLLDKSLVLPEGGDAGVGRYRLLETVRAYAREQLAGRSREAAAVRRRHAACFLALAEEAEPELRGPRQTAWLRRLDAEHDNLRAALRWTLPDAAGETETGLRLGGAVARYWELRGHLGEGRGWLEALLAAAGGPATPPARRAKAENAAGNLAKLQGEYAAAGARYERGLALWQEAGDRRGVAIAAYNLAEVARGRGDLADAVRRYEAALLLHREVGNGEGVAAALIGLGIAARNRGDAAGAVAYYEEALALSRQRGDANAVAVVLNNLATVAGAQGDLERAAALQEESLALRRDLGDVRGTALALKNLADTAQRRGAAGRAAALLAEALGLYRRAESRDGVAVCLEAVSRVAAPGTPTRATRLLGRPAALREAIGVPLAPADRAEREATAAAARRALGAATFAAQTAAGRVLPLEAAIAEALATAAAVPDGPAAAAAGDRLTARQREVAALVARGRTNREIAATLVIAERTAETHVDHILTRLGFTSRAQIAAWATEQGLAGGR